MGHATKPVPISAYALYDDATWLIIYLQRHMTKYWYKKTCCETISEVYADITGATTTDTLFVSCLKE